MKRCPILIAFLFLILTGCGSERAEESNQTTSTVFAMDTVMSLTAYAPEHSDATSNALNAAEAEIHRLDKLLSVSSESGDIFQLNRDGTASVSKETYDLIARALQIAKETNGDFDPTVYPLMEAWGFTTEQYAVPGQSTLDNILLRVGYQQVQIQEDANHQSWTITLPNGGGLDLGGIAKGYTGQKVISAISEAGVSSAIVSLGGNVACLGLHPDGSPWTVAIRNPSGDGTIATLSLGQAGTSFSIVTSGAYERYFEQDGQIYHHILDPQTGAPAKTDILSVTVVSTDGTLADALSTALFVKGFDEAVSFWQAHADEFEMVLIKEDGLYVTNGLTISSEAPIYTLEVES